MAKLNWGSGWRYLQNGNLVYDLQGGIQTLNSEISQVGGIFNLSAEYNTNADLDSNSIGSFQQDIAQNRYFTVTVSEIRDKDNKPITFHTGGAFHKFLPVKSMALSYTSYENLSVPLACLGGVPLLNKKRLSVIRLSCYDTDDDIIEKAVQRWEMRCFPRGKYVAYMDEVAAEFQYKSYDVKGNLVFVKTLYVIPSDDVNVSRDYESNSEKLVTFSLAAVGEPGVSANNNPYRGFKDTFEAAPAAGGSETATQNNNNSNNQGTPLPPYSTEVANTRLSSTGVAIQNTINGTLSPTTILNTPNTISRAARENIDSDAGLQLQKAINNSIQL